jgi:hypothetical protein
MNAIKSAKTASRERSSLQNGLPEPVPYVYREQQRRNTYAARIARRNAQGQGKLADQATTADGVLGVDAAQLVTTQQQPASLSPWPADRRTAGSRRDVALANPFSAVAIFAAISSCVSPAMP